MKNKFLKNSLKVLLLVLVLSAGLHFSHSAMAANSTLGLEGGGAGFQLPGSEVQISSAIPQETTLGDLIKAMVNYFIGFLGFIAILTFVYAGVLWVVSGGDETMITKAKKIMTYSSLGLVVVLLSFSIVTFITGSADQAALGTGITCSETNNTCKNGSVCDFEKNICVSPKVGITCESSADCGNGAICDVDRAICISRDVGIECSGQSDCGNPLYAFCNDQQRCQSIVVENLLCDDDSQCSAGYSCIKQMCYQPKTACNNTDKCLPGFYCSAESGTCLDGNDVICQLDGSGNATNCPAPKECDNFGYCRNPNATIDSACETSADCPFDTTAFSYVCNIAKHKCEVAGTVIGPLESCDPANSQCPWGYSCQANIKNEYICQIANTDTSSLLTQPCTDDSQCPWGYSCNIAKSVCQINEDITRPDVSCTTDASCPFGYTCNTTKKVCEIPGGILGGVTQATSEDTLNTIDKAISALEADLGNITEEINSLSEEDKAAVTDALGAGTLADKMAGVDSLLKGSTDPTTIKVLEKVLSGLQRLQLLRDEMDELRAVMPESAETIKSYDEASQVLDELIDDPTSNIKLRRFENMYRTLKESIRKFPIVISRIKASPGEGNVPFTVILDGLDSTDPTGGTISEYKWSFLDNAGNVVSLGNSPVAVYEFKEPNTYSVRLQVSTASKDKAGYKTAMDGISTVRIKANPPSSKVAFRVNGAEVLDVFHVTLAEAKAGISFDPAPTVPAIGRTISKYEWLYGDNTNEERTVPATVIHSYGKAGEYFVTLKTTDSIGLSDKRILKLNVKSLAADIEFTPGEGNVNTEFRFRGINSRSDDGIIDTYQWKITDDSGAPITSSSQENFYYIFDRPGKYNVELTVTDSSGAQDKGIRVLDVFSRKPVASFDFETPEPNHPNTIQFSAAGSYDPDQGDQITYSWDFNGDGQFEVVDSKDVTASYTYKKAGEYKVNLQVQDSFNQRGQIEKGVSVESVLAGDISIDKKAAQVGEEITFKANSENAVAYLWEFGDGTTMSTEDKSVTHKYDKKGKFNVKLNFFDRDDNTNSDTSFVLIGEGESPIAVADVLVDGRNQLIVDDLCGAGESGYMVSRSDNLSLSARDSINRDGSSRLLTYDWKFSNGTRNNKRDFTHRFDEINALGECSTASLVVRDDISGQVSDENTLYFKVINQLPNIIDFVVEGETGKELITPTKVRLKVVGAKDEDGQIKKYKWWYHRQGFDTEQLGVHSTTSSETEMVITAQGDPGVKNRYFFAVEITDNDNGVFISTERFGDTAYLDVTNGPNISPVAEFTVDKTTVAVGDSIAFTSQSYDPQGDIIPNSGYQWDFDGDGSFDDTTSGPTVSRQFNTPGEYEVRLKVTNRGLSSTARRTVFVEPTNSYPQAAYTYTVNGNTVKFDGNSSRFDPDLEDTKLRFQWDFDIQQDFDGNGINDDDVQSTDVAPSFTFGAAKLYRVKLTVLDSLGNKGVVVRDVDLGLSEAQRAESTYHSVKLSAPEQPLTTLELSITPFNISRGETADVSVVVSNADNSSYNGNVFFEVMEGAGEFTPNPVKALEGRATAIFTAVDSGAVRIRVKATGTYYGDVTEEVVLNVR